MESIHIDELRALLRSQRSGDPDQFLRLDFAKIGDDGSPAYDPEYSGKVITVNSVSGLVTITFNNRGYLVSIDVE